MEDVNEKVEQDPKMEIRLKTINGVGLHIEQAMEPVKRDLLVRKGVISGMTSAAALVHKVMQEVQTKIDDEENDFTGEDAKPILHWLAAARASILESAQINNTEHAKQDGIIEGIKRSANLCETLFKQEAAKGLRRANDHDRDETDEGGRPLPIREVMENQGD